mgnify:CR=1 FL=1
MNRKTINVEGVALSKIIWLLSALVVGLLVSKIFIANQLATTGALASSNSTQLAQLRAGNQRLQNEVSSLGSIAQLYSRAEKLGLKPVSKIEILRSRANVAYSR